MQLMIAPFDRLHKMLFWLSVVTMSSRCTVSIITQLIYENSKITLVTPFRVIHQVRPTLAMTDLYTKFDVAFIHCRIFHLWNDDPGTVVTTFPLSVVIRRTLNYRELTP